MSSERDKTKATDETASVGDGPLQSSCRGKNGSGDHTISKKLATRGQKWDHGRKGLES
jgi:hypothetical protein